MMYNNVVREKNCVQKLAASKRRLFEIFVNNFVFFILNCITKRHFVKIEFLSGNIKY